MQLKILLCRDIEPDVLLPQSVEDSRCIRCGLHDITKCSVGNVLPKRLAYNLCTSDDGCLLCDSEFIRFIRDMKIAGIIS